MLSGLVEFRSRRLKVQILCGRGALRASAISHKRSARIELDLCLYSDQRLISFRCEEAYASEILQERACPAPAAEYLSAQRLSWAGPNAVPDARSCGEIIFALICLPTRSDPSPATASGDGDLPQTSRHRTWGQCECAARRRAEPEIRAANFPEPAPCR